MVCVCMWGILPASSLHVFESKNRGRVKGKEWGWRGERKERKTNTVEVSIDSGLLVGRASEELRIVSRKCNAGPKKNKVLFPKWIGILSNIAKLQKSHSILTQARKKNSSLRVHFIFFFSLWFNKKTLLIHKKKWMLLPCVKCVMCLF